MRIISYDTTKSVDALEARLTQYRVLLVVYMVMIFVIPALTFWYGQMVVAINYMECFNRAKDAFVCADVWVVGKP